MNQRWRHGRDSYRPAGEPIATHLYEVAPIAADNGPKAFVIEHHYSGTYPAARFRFGLYRRGQLVGVAVFSHPCNNKVLTSVFPGDPLLSVELGRFVLLDDVEANGETWFLARSFEGLRRESIEGVVSFSDPVARRTAAGLTVFPGHVGTIYQAHNGKYLGRSTARTLRVLPDGSIVSDRALQKIRSGERGWVYAARILEQHGAPAPTGDRRTWLRTWLPRITKTLRHAGNHRYAWGLRRSRRLVATAAAPKEVDIARERSAA